MNTQTLLRLTGITDLERHLHRLMPPMQARLAISHSVVRDFIRLDDAARNPQLSVTPRPFSITFLPAASYEEKYPVQNNRPPAGRSRWIMDYETKTLFICKQGGNRDFTRDDMGVTAEALFILQARRALATFTNSLADDVRGVFQRQSGLLTTILTVGGLARADAVRGVQDHYMAKDILLTPPMKEIAETLVEQGTISLPHFLELGQKATNTVRKILTPPPGAKQPDSEFARDQARFLLSLFMPDLLHAGKFVKSLGYADPQGGEMPGYWYRFARLPDALLRREAAALLFFLTDYAERATADPEPQSPSGGATRGKLVLLSGGRTGGPHRPKKPAIRVVIGGATS